MMPSAAMAATPSKINIRLRAAAFLLVLLALPYGGGWLLQNPGNVFNQLFRGPVTEYDAHLLVGPYPIEADFERLQRSGVRTVVSLIDGQLSYEQALLTRERAAAARFGMQVLNFPMASLLAQQMNSDYERNAVAAARAIEGTSERVYLHCYLDEHRVKAVLAHLGHGRQDTLTVLPGRPGWYLIRISARRQPAPAHAG
jgi:protein tyrosine phosphatase (PTP) superfamily phosphohydrolase (DUF442 family)